MSKSILKGLVRTGVTCALFGMILARQSYAEEQSGSFDFNVTVNKTLEVSVKGEGSADFEQNTTASKAGGIGEFLCTSFTLKVSTNNAHGFNATMTTIGTDTTLRNQLDSMHAVPTLTEDKARSVFPTNYWGFSLNDTECNNEESNYHALLGSNTAGSLVAYSNVPVTDATKDVYFGMKADATKMAGDYKNTVVLTVVTNAEVIEPEDEENTEVDVPDNTNPSQAPARTMARSAAPSDDEEEDNTPSGVKPKGVIEDTTSERNEKIIDSSKVGAGIALGVTTIAASGVIFFVVAKRREDDDEEEE